MRFHIQRTSQHNDSKPCDEATRGIYTAVDTRYVLDLKNGSTDWWYNEGTNHRLINGWFARDTQQEDWFVEFSSLNELVDFADRYDEIIILETFGDPMERTLEIYDYYRE